MSDSNLSKQAISKIRSLARRSGGVLTAQAVLDEAARPDSPLHSYFTWDDGEAAHRFRLIQAGQLICRVKVTITQGETLEVRAAITTRAYEPTGEDGKGRTVYRPIADVLSDPERYAEALSSARRELEALERRYRHLVELKPIFDAYREQFAA